jgi:hypothetical protein
MQNLVTLSFTTEQLTAIDQTRSAFASIQGNLRALTDHARSVNGLLGTLGVALSGAGFAAFVKGSIDAADELDELSQKAGIAADFYMKTLHSTNYWSTRRPDQMKVSSLTPP